MIRKSLKFVQKIFISDGFLVRPGRIGHKSLSIIIRYALILPSARDPASLALKGTPAAAFDSPWPLQNATTVTLACYGWRYVRPGRIELPTKPWQGLIIPLNHGRKSLIF